MNYDEDTKAPDSAKMRASAQHPTCQSEAQAIELAAIEARDAAREAWNDLNRLLRESADPRIVARSHPWISMGVATALGFAAGAQVANLTTAHEKENPSTPDLNGRAHTVHKHDTTNPNPLWAHRFFELAKVAISTAITAFVQAQSTKQAEHSETM